MYKWKWMVLGARVCIKNADFVEQKVNDNIVIYRYKHANSILFDLGDFTRFRS